MRVTFGCTPSIGQQISALRLVLVLACVTLVDGMSYMCLFPSNLRPGSDYNVGITVLKASSPINLQASLTSPSGSVISSGTAVANAAGVTTLISLSIPLQLSNGLYELKVSGSGGINFANTTKVKVFLKPASIFIQTDKAKYKPGQKVLFRVVAIYPTMKPYTGNMAITITDEQDHKMSHWNHKDPKGYFNGELQLSSRTPLGMWKIEVVIPDSDFPATKTFEVTEYELPKFEVTISSSLHYFLFTKKPQAQQLLRIPVMAKYTYGEPVKGVVNFAVSIIEKGNMHSDTDRTWEKTMTLTDGVVTAEMNLEELSSIVPSSLKERSPEQPPWTKLDSSSINIIATVVEAGTGDEITSTIIVQCHLEKYGLYFSNVSSGSFKPDETYTGYLELKQKDGSEPTESDIRLPNKDFRVIVITLSAGPPCPAKVVQNNVPLTISGFVRFSFDPKDFNCDQITLKASFHDELSNDTISVVQTIQKFKSKANQYIKIDLDKMHYAYKTGEELNFTIRTTQKSDTFHYVVMSKGSIVLAQTVASPSNPYSLKLELTRELAQQLSPRGRVVVWFVPDGAEVISDSVEFNVDGAFANEVTIALGKTTVEPGKQIYMEIHGEPGSVAFVLAVDKSVLLLKGDNDITQDMALKDLMTYDIAHGEPRPSGLTSNEIFARSKLSYMTDGLVYSTVGDSSVAFQEYEAYETYTRMCFPETWIWSNITIRNDGVGYLRLKVPDTITTFVATAFAVHEKIGLGIARHSSQIKVFLPMFVAMKFPSLVRNEEQFALRATVYNFFDSVQKVTVTLKASPFFDVQQRSGVVQNKDISRQIQVPRKDAVSVSFWIITKRPGQIPIVVSAKTGLSEDVENRTLVVIPEGVEQSYSTSLFIDLKKGAPDYNGTFKIELPPKDQLVPFSEQLEITVVGDILGPSVDGAGDLIDMPGGCGEQKMINIAPAVYMLDYLEITKTLTADMKVTLEKQLLDGYQQALTSQRSDKSFSAWGENDETGSIWLTAFALKTFNNAVQKNRIPIEMDTLADTLDWIISHQNATGAFSEPDKGRVYHVEMQGGTGKGISMTAYILITLIESRNNEHIDSSVLERSISKAVAFLESKLSSINDPYALSIITYALVLAKSKMAGYTQKKLDALAHVAADKRHWGDSVPLAQKKKGVFNPPYVQASAKDIEMTSYALLAYAKQKKINEALPIVKWIISQRNPTGGFASTQDTVVALEALTQYAKVASGVRATVNLKVKAKAGAQEKAFRPIEANTVFGMQHWEPKDKLVKTIDISASGFGKAIVQLDVSYYVRNTASIAYNGGISMNVTTETKDKMVTIKTCTRAGNMTKGPTGMALETIDPVSGFVPVDLNEVDTSDNVKQLEIDGHQVTVYYEKLDGNTTCTSIKMKKEFAILNAKNACVTCIDYYNPDNFVTAIYGFDEPRATWESLCPTCAG